MRKKLIFISGLVLVAAILFFTSPLKANASQNSSGKMVFQANWSICGNLSAYVGQFKICKVEAETSGCLPYRTDQFGFKEMTLKSGKYEVIPVGPASTNKIDRYGWSIDPNPFYIKPGQITQVSGVVKNEALMCADRSTGWLGGKISIGPSCPGPVSLINCSLKPNYSGLKVVVYDESGKTKIREVEVSRDGDYSVPLPVGSYMVGTNYHGPYKPSLQAVSIEDDKITTLNINIDTGLR